MNYSGKSKMMKRYADGGETVEYVEAGSGPSEDSSPMEAAESKAEEPSKPEYKSFKEAFAAERKAGNKTFEYMGKKYTTDMAARTAARDTGSDVARKAASQNPDCVQKQTVTVLKDMLPNALLLVQKLRQTPHVVVAA